MAKISVIVPVFNAQKYLADCLDSLLCQTFKDIEIICVNDGSKDDSLRILKEYAARDGRIRVFSQRNRRQGAARNLGMQKSSGNYIFFVDADDWLDENALELLWKKARESDADIVLTGTRLYDENKNSLNRDWCNYEKEKDLTDGIPPRDFFRMMAPCCSRFHKAEFIKNNHIRFIEHCFYEDNSWGGVTSLLAEKIGFIPNVYCYRQHSGSTTGIKDHKVFDWVKDFKYFCRQVKKRKISSSALKMAYFWYLRNFLYYMEQLSEKNKKIFYAKITGVLKYFDLSETDFQGGLENGEGLLRFWNWLKQKDFYRRRKLSFYLFGILFYQIRTWPDNSKTEHLLLGFIPLYEYKRRQKKRR